MAVLAPLSENHRRRGAPLGPRPQPRLRTRSARAGAFERAAAATAAAGRPAHLVGWSLGGYIAREVARELSEQVARVVTLGSPVVGGPKFTAVGKLYESWGFDLEAMARDVEMTRGRADSKMKYSRSTRRPMPSLTGRRASTNVRHG
jgi:pimeloyl-ACP methyl ester carboxylesterase